MLRGTRVLWASREDYYDLKIQMVNQGRRAFFKEKQNEPAVGGDSFFDPTRAVRFRLAEGRIFIMVRDGSSGAAEEPGPLLVDLVIAGFLDSALGGGSRAGDDAAIVTVGADAAGYLYVLDVWMRRAAPTRQIAALFDLYEKWRHAHFGMETNCFQELLLLPIEEERRRRREAGSPWLLPIREVHHAQSKDVRIGTLEPLVTNGWLRFAVGLPDPFWAQLEGFPGYAHDDALDALEGAVALLRSNRPHAPGRGARRSSLNHLSGF
jgi:predicted phage terminase large subunit-like protein